MADNGFAEPDYEDQFVSVDAASTVLEAIVNANLDGRDQEVEHEDLGEGDPIPPDSPTKTQVTSAGKTQWQTKSFPVITTLRAYQSKLRVACSKVDILHHLY